MKKRNKKPSRSKEFQEVLEKLEQEAEETGGENVFSKLKNGKGIIKELKFDECPLCFRELKINNIGFAKLYECSNKLCTYVRVKKNGD